MRAWSLGKLGWLWKSFALMLFSGIFGGCGGTTSPKPNTETDPSNPTPAMKVSSPPVQPSEAPIDTKLEQWLNQPFKQAVLLEPPDNVLRPPDKTKAGKSVGKIYEAIAGADANGGIWKEIRFISPQGKRLQYTATLQTDLGSIKILLLPEIAPNHVRNFLALAKVGYFDGLAFDRTLCQELPEEKGHFKYLEAGCPLGTGEWEYGSIGYWLKPELSDKVVHEDGTVGAWHGIEVESAACKFYITLSKAPWMDGNYTVFGKMIQGLDVAHRIVTRPVRADDETKDRPQEPVIIRAVTIACAEVEEGQRKPPP